MAKVPAFLTVWSSSDLTPEGKGWDRGGGWEVGGGGGGCDLGKVTERLGKKAGWKGGRSVCRLATEPRYLLSPEHRSHRGLLPSPAALPAAGMWRQNAAGEQDGSRGSHPCQTTPSSLPVSSSVSRPFSREPQALGFLERPKYLISKLSGPPGPSPTQPHNRARKELSNPPPPAAAPSPAVWEASQGPTSHFQPPRPGPRSERVMQPSRGALRPGSGGRLGGGRFQREQGEPGGRVL